MEFLISTGFHFPHSYTLRYATGSGVKRVVNVVNERVKRDKERSEGQRTEVAKEVGKEVKVKR